MIRVQLFWVVLAGITLSGCATSRYSQAVDSLPEASSVDRIEQIMARAEPQAVREPMSRRGNAQQYQVWGQTYQVQQDLLQYEQEGTASWYGQKFHGYETSNGEVFDVFKFTAAHKSLPLPSYVRVTNLANQSSLVVRVNDRGPFHGDRLIDLSYAAAVRLGFAKQGTAKVRVELLAPPLRENDYQHIQIEAFSQRSSAERLKNQIEFALGTQPALQKLSVYIYEAQHQGAALHKVRIGPVAPDQVSQVQLTLQAQNLNGGMVLPPEVLFAEKNGDAVAVIEPATGSLRR